MQKRICYSPKQAHTGAKLNSLEEEFGPDTKLMCEPEWACEMHFTHLISGLALRCQYGWSHRFFHITLTTSWALLSTVLISGETPLYTLIDTHSVCPACGAKTVGNTFLESGQNFHHAFHTHRNKHRLFLRCSILKVKQEKQCGQSENKWKSEENLSEAASLAEQKYIATTGRKRRKTAVVLHSLNKELFYLSIQHVCMWVSVM